MLNKHFKSCLFALATCLIGGGAPAQSDKSKSELLEDLLSGSDVCVNLGYVSEDGINSERLEYEKKLMSVNQQLAEALAELDTIKSEAGESNSSSMDERLDFLRDAVMQCEMKYAALSEEANSDAENGKSDPELNQQVLELKRQLSALQSILTLSEEKEAEKDIQLQNLGARLNAALARVASEERKKRQMEQSLRLEIESKLNEIEKLKSTNSNPENLGKYITQYKKTVQRLLNEKNCDAGTVDGVIGSKTVKAAERFAKTSGFKQRNSLIYDEKYFNNLVNSKKRCRDEVIDDAFAGSWNIRTICSDKLFFATAELFPISDDQYEILDYENNFYEKASGRATLQNSTLIIDLSFENSRSSYTAYLKKTGLRLTGSTASGCKVQAIPRGGKVEFTRN